MRLSDYANRNRLSLSLALAALIHLLFLFFLQPIGDLLADPPAERRLPETLSFEFAESDADATPVPQDTRYASDRNARSRDESGQDLRRTETPFSAGDVRYRDAFETSSGQQAPDAPIGNAPYQADAGGGPVVDVSEHNLANEGSTPATPAQLTKEQREKAVYGVPAARPRALATINTESRALDDGGIQLSTYEWDFAPYLAYLKRRIQGNIYPPNAFTQFGMIQGETTLKFRIYPDGTSTSPGVLGFEGSELLRDTSVQAVEISAPFKALPDNFPDPYLEITALFAYVILRNPGR